MYVHDITFEEIRLPLLKMEYANALSPESLEILRLLRANRDKDLSEMDMAKLLGKHKATVNHHLRNLLEKGAIRLDRHPLDSRKKIVRMEESTELLLGDDD